MFKKGLALRESFALLVCYFGGNEPPQKYVRTYFSYSLLGPFSESVATELIDPVYLEDCLRH